MSLILDIVTKLQDTQASIAQAERAIQQMPKSEAIRATATSLYKRLEKLNADFQRIANQNFMDVLSYRFISDEHARYTAGAVGSVLRDFQTFLSTVYDSVKTGQPKKRARVSEQAQSESELNIGYCYSGSFGFMFTIPNDRLLAVESDLDVAVKSAFELIQSKSTAPVAEFARKFGVAPVRSAYQLATDHVEGRLSADIRWIREGHDRATLTMQPQEFQYLKSIIDTISDEQEETIQISGILLGADIKSRSFHFFGDDGREYQGRFHEDFLPIGELVLERRYEARVRIVTTTHFATELDEVDFELVSLN